MSALLDAALGPLFRATALFLVLGVAREVLLRLVPGLSLSLVTGSGRDGAAVVATE